MGGFFKERIFSIRSGETLPHKHEFLTAKASVTYILERLVNDSPFMEARKLSLQFVRLTRFLTATSLIEKITIFCQKFVHYELRNPDAIPTMLGREILTYWKSIEDLYQNREFQRFH